MKQPLFGPRKKIILKPVSGKGLGLFSCEWINVDEVIDITPVLVLSKDVSTFLMSHPKVADQLFLWEEDKSNNPILAIGFGNVSMVNHSNYPNATIERVNGKFPGFKMLAKQKIRPNEEILLQYRLPLQNLC